MDETEVKDNLDIQGVEVEEYYIENDELPEKVIKAYCLDRNSYFIPQVYIIDMIFEKPEILEDELSRKLIQEYIFSQYDKFKNQDTLVNTLVRVRMIDEKTKVFADFGDIKHRKKPDIDEIYKGLKEPYSKNDKAFIYDILTNRVVASGLHDYAARKLGGIRKGMLCFRIEKGEYIFNDYNYNYNIPNFEREFTNSLKVLPGKPDQKLIRYLNGTTEEYIYERNTWKKIS